MNGPISSARRPGPAGSGKRAPRDRVEPAGRGNGKAQRPVNQEGRAMTVSSRRWVSRFWALVGAACVPSVVLALGLPATAQAATSPGFDDQASLFKFFYDCQPPRNPCP